MCQAPNTIPNPNFGSDKLAAFGKDTVSRYLTVPCGHCDECIAVKQMYFVQRIQMEALDNHLFYATITYNNATIPVYETSTGYRIRYGDVSDVQKMYKRLRKRNAFGRPFRHFTVYELGEKRGRPHFHVLFMLPKHKNDTLNDCLQLESVMFKEVLSEWKRNVSPIVWNESKQRFEQEWRNPEYEPLCTYVRRFIHGKLRTNYDLHYVRPDSSDNGEADVGFYVLKYMLKPSDRETRLRRALHLNLPEDEYEKVWSLVRPRHFESECFGLGQTKYVIGSDGRPDKRKPIPTDSVLKHLRNGIESSKKLSPYPYFFNPVDGSHFPLSRYYKRFSDIYSVGDFYDFYFNDTKSRLDNVVIDERILEQDLTAARQFSERVKQVDLKSMSNDLDDIFDL